MSWGSSVSACVLVLVFAGACSINRAQPLTDAGLDKPSLPDIKPVDLLDQVQLDVPFGHEGQVSPDGSVCGLVISRINGKTVPAQISSLDDKDPKAVGIQIDVLVQAFNVLDGVEITLLATGMPSPMKATVVGGFAAFTGVTIILPTGGIATITASAPGCQTSMPLQMIPDPTCVFAAPAPGATLMGPLTILLNTTHATGGSVVALIDGSMLGTRPVASATGIATFAKQILPDGPHVVTATVQVPIPGGQKLSAPCLSNSQTNLNFTVDTSAPPCTLVSFEPMGLMTPSGLVLVDADLSTAGLQNTITVHTDSGTNVDISLVVDYGPTSGGPATFGPKSTTSGSVAFDVTFAKGNPGVHAICRDVMTTHQGQSSVTKVVIGP